MRAEGIMRNKLGNEDLLVDLAANIGVSLSLIAVRIVRRRSGKRYDFYIFI